MAVEPERWLRAVQKVTGYGPETLRAQRMEAARWEEELGVSSHKRERVLELLQREVPLDEATLEHLRRTSTLAGWRRVLAGEGPPSAVGPETQGGSSREAAWLTEAQALEAVLDAVVERTGYARAQLDLDADLEADLGIDSVKQAQVLGHLRRRFPMEFRGGLRLRDFPTLRAWAGFVFAAARGQRLEAGTKRAHTGTPGAVREQISWEEAPLPVSPARPLAARWRLLTAGTCPASAAFMEAWNALAEAGAPDVSGVVLWVGLAPEERPLADALWSALEALREEHGTEGLQVLVLGEGELEGAGESPLFAAASGALKSLAAEDATLQVSFLRLAQGLLETAPGACAREALEEVRRGGGAEAALDAGLRRHVRQAKAAPMGLDQEERWHWPERPRVLVTGGARGIAARVATELARRVGARLLLVGRSAQEVAAVQATLAAVRAAGGEAIYLSEDVSGDGAAGRVMAEALRAWGGLDVVLHAAGILEDGPFGEKTPESFRRALAPKVTGAQRLIEASGALPVFPCAWVGFSSVSAWRGNALQVDYAAANEAMAAVLRSGAGARGARVRILDFGPWDEVGMAAQSGLATVLREAGEGLVPVEDGIEAVFTELAFGPEWSVESTWLPGPAVQPGAVQGALGLLDHAASGPRHLEGGRTLSAERDLWLSDHSPLDVPLLPACMGLELMVAAAQLLLPGWAWVGIKGFTIHGGVALVGAETQALVVKASAMLAGQPGLRAVHCRLELPGERPSYEATVLLSRCAVDWPPPTARPSPPDTARRSRSHELYGHLRLGPAFRLLDEAQVELGDADGPALAWVRTVALTPARYFHERDPEVAFASNPLLLETGFQGAAWLGLQQHGSVMVPRAFGALRVHGPVDASLPVEWTVVARGHGRFELCALQDGRVVAEVLDYEAFDATALTAWLGGHHGPATAP